MDIAEMTDIVDITEQENYITQFARFEKLTGGRPEWLAAMRRAGMLRFNDLGFPTRNDEEWRFTNPAQIAETPFTVADEKLDAAWLSNAATEFRELISNYLVTDSDGIGIVVLNGRCVTLSTGLSVSEEQPCVMPISYLLESMPDSDHAARISHHLGKYADFQSHGITALNTAFFEDGAYIYIPRNAVVDRPIEIIYVSSPGEDGTHPMNSPRTLIFAEENSRATIIETFIGTPGGRRLTNAVTEVVVADGAVVDHYKRCEEPSEAFHVGAMSIHLGRSCNFSSHCFTMGGELVRNEVSAILKGEHAECTLNGLYLGSGTQVVDNHTTIDHAAANCNSHEVYKGILAGRSRGVFNGKIFVRLDAQKTDAKQTNKTLLLSPDARIDTKPQLEILADDVKCTHGATVGQLDPNQIFYLRARGIPEIEARSLLTYAFAGDIVQRVKVDALRKALDQKLLDLLPKRGAAPQ